MKIQIILTQFLEDVVDDICDVMGFLGIKGFNITAEFPFSRTDLCYDLVKRCTNKINAELAEWSEYDDKPTDLLDCLEWCSRMLVDLSIIQDLEVPYYANPNYISNAITILSEKFSEQLQAKALGEAYYNEYYCKRLASVLAELCELIKEA